MSKSMHKWHCRAWVVACDVGAFLFVIAGFVATLPAFVGVPLALLYGIVRIIRFAWTGE